MEIIFGPITVRHLTVRANRIADMRCGCEPKKNVAVRCILPDRREFGWEGAEWWGSTTDERAGDRRDCFSAPRRTVILTCWRLLNAWTGFHRLLCVVSSSEAPLPVVLVRMWWLATVTVIVSLRIIVPWLFNDGGPSALLMLAGAAEPVCCY